MPPAVIRRAVRADCPGILAIYNDAVLKTTASYDEEPRTLEHRVAWFDAHERDDLAVFVAEEPEADGSAARIVGWSALNRYHERAAYRFTAENSVYIAEDWRGRGLGSRLLAPLLSAARDRGLHAVLAVIDAANEASIRLHARHGFQPVGHLKEVGFKFGRWLDVMLMEWRGESVVAIPQTPALPLPCSASPRLWG
ncbi:MAG: N-acetyltransferase [Verrucomicrobiae bacterium]|nr:N-acetyltransferase [Verrucomicrobiae bacterium]